MVIKLVKDIRGFFWISKCLRMDLVVLWFREVESLGYEVDGLRVFLELIFI